MQYTNRLNLPKSVVNAVTRDPYDNKGTLSVTTLIKPPQMRILELRHKDEIVEDVSDRLWSLYGQSVHHILERCVDDGDIAEQRIHAEIGGVRVSGQFDLLTVLRALQDFKMTSVWAIKDALANGKKEWEQQLNLLAVLVRKDDLMPHPKKLQIVAFAKDWRNSEMLRDFSGYPNKVEVIDVPMWKPEEAMDFMEKRVLLHQSAEKGLIVECTDEERWKKDDVWAVMKKGRKSALRLLGSEFDAVVWCVDNGHTNSAEMIDGNLTGDLKTGISIELRPGSYVRCENYCSCSEFCPQFNIR